MANWTDYSLLDLVDVELDEERIERRRLLFRRIPEKIRPMLERAIDDFADEINLHHRRTQNARGMTEKGMLDHYMDAKKKKNKGKMMTLRMMGKLPESNPVTEALTIRDGFIARVHQLVSSPGMSKDDLDELTKEACTRAFKEAVKRADKAFFLMKQNF